MPEGGCDPVGSLCSSRILLEPWREEPTLEQVWWLVTPWGTPCWSSLFLKDCTLWKGPMLGQFMKSCSPREGLTLEKFVENCLP